MKKVAEHFAGYFQLPTYTGTYGTQESDVARRDFFQLTEHIVWSQVHGDFKDAALRANFEPYQHWSELYQCCKDILREHNPDKLDSWYGGHSTNAKIMGEVMSLMRARHGADVPKCWLAIMRKLRGQTPRQKQIA